MSETTLVFGGSGFIGTHYVRRLALSGQKIVSIDLLPPREILDGVDYQIGDVRDLRNFTVPPGTVRIYNFAAVHTTPGHPDYAYHETNVGGAVEICRIASQFDIKEIIFTSSISVYGPGEETKREDAVLSPASAYGYSKMLAEKIHTAWYENGAERRLTIVRPAVVFGPGERGNFTRMASLLRKGFFIFPGRRDTIKACIYVGDLIEAIEFARSNPDNFVLFNGAYPQRYTTAEIVNTFIGKYFPRAKTFDIPLPLVLGGANILRALGAFNLGIHPERVTKLVRSTNVYPGWLANHGQSYPDALERALNNWALETSGRFD